MLVLTLRTLASEGAEWDIVATDHFRVYHVDDAATALRVARVSEETLGQVAHRLRLEVAAPIQVWIAESPEDLRSLTKAPIRDWAQGYAFPRDGEIVLLRPTGSGRWDELDRIARHEVAHICLGLVVGDSTEELPLWFHEGFAMYASEQWTLRDQWTLLSASIFRQLVPLSDLDRRFPDEGGEARIAYAQSFSAVRSLATDYSFTQLRTLVERLGAGEAFESAFRGTFGISVVMFDAEWRARSSSGVEWAALFGGVLAVGAFFAPFLVLGYWRRTRIRRRRLEVWEREESKPDRFFQQ